MNTLALQVNLARRCFSLAGRSSIRSFSSTRFSANEEPKNVQADDAQSDAQADPSEIKGFFEKGIISEPVYRALTQMKFKNFTPVQTQTIEPISKIEKGIVARAKTGTGKTLAFGIPLIEKALKRQDPHKNPDVIGLVISPTRDLAYQIRDELIKVTKQFDRKAPQVNIHCLVGGESRSYQIRAFTRFRTTPQVVVATPGRLFDLLEEPVIQDALKNLEFKVLDEADRLLDDGFKDDLLNIQDRIAQIKQSTGGSPTEKTLLFSATIDRNVLSFAENLMGRNLTYIDTVDPNEPETHENIEQSLINTGNFFQSYVAAARFISEQSKENKHFKAIVFLPTVKSVSYFREILTDYTYSEELRLPVSELHGKLSQAVRDRSVKNFRERSRAVLVTSDVGARGMDFPSVTNVIQIGVPTDTTNYVHRIGRTARGGKKGQALLILAQCEKPFVHQLERRNIEITHQTEYSLSEEEESKIINFSTGGRHKFTLTETMESLLGFYNGTVKSYRLRLENILQSISESYATLSGEPDKLPRISKAILSKVLNISDRTARRYFDLSFGPSGDRFDGDMIGDRFGDNKLDQNDRSDGGKFGRGRFGRDRHDDDNHSNDRFSNDRFSNDRNSRFGGNKTFSSRDNKRNSSRGGDKKFKSGGSRSSRGFEF